MTACLQAEDVPAGQPAVSATGSIVKYYHPKTKQELHPFGAPVTAAAWEKDIISNPALLVHLEKNMPTLLSQFYKRVVKRHTTTMVLRPSTIGVVTSRSDGSENVGVQLPGEVGANLMLVPKRPSTELVEWTFNDFALELQVLALNAVARAARRLLAAPPSDTSPADGTDLVVSKAAAAAASLLEHVESKIKLYKNHDAELTKLQIYTRDVHVMIGGQSKGYTDIQNLNKNAEVKAACQFGTRMKQDLMATLKEESEGKKHNRLSNLYTPSGYETVEGGWLFGWMR